MYRFELRGFCCAAATLITAWTLSGVGSAQDHLIHNFDRVQLTDTYYSEGASAGDVNGDGVVDVVYGPFWFEGPDYKKPHEIYAPVPQPVERYADNFFSWIYDFNADGWNDVFVVGFPGTPAYVYENPKRGGLGEHWPKHEVFDWVSNESPHFTNLVGDERPELVCTRDGFFGYATIDPKAPFESWRFHPISDKSAPPKFGHGLGVGDVNGDGRHDIVFSGGWFEQPASEAGSSRWPLHAAKLTSAYGGAEMHVYDVDGDGDRDIITSMAAHDFGLAWYEQVAADDGTAFKPHLIMGSRREENKYGVLFSELHSVNLADIDGDGLKDIVTGKTYWSHHRQSPMWDAGAVVYWFRLVRGTDGVDWVPYRADTDPGIGRQLAVHDVNGDGQLDLVMGGMKGAHVLIHRRIPVDQQGFDAAQPKVYSGGSSKVPRGPRSSVEEKTGKVAGAIEGEDLKVLAASRGKTSSQDMSGFTKDQWSNARQLFWTGGKPGDRLELALAVDQAGTYDLAIAMTMARDYGIVQLYLDDEPVGQALDLYHYPDVITTGVVRLGAHSLSAGEHRLGIEITGANIAAVKSYMVGVDYVVRVAK